jgi:hypothetical protein
MTRLLRAAAPRDRNGGAGRRDEMTETGVARG